MTSPIDEHVMIDTYRNFEMTFFIDERMMVSSYRNFEVTLAFSQQFLLLAKTTRLFFSKAELIVLMTSQLEIKQRALTVMARFQVSPIRKCRGYVS